MKLRDEKLGYSIIISFYGKSSDNPECIGFREIKRRTKASNDGIRYWLKQLKQKKWVGQIISKNNRKRKYYLTFDIRNDKTKEQILSMFVDRRKNVTRQKRDGKTLKQSKWTDKRDRLSFFVLRIAARGIQHSKRSPELKPRDVLIQPHPLRSQGFYPSRLETIHGVGINDFMFDNRFALTTGSLTDLGFKKSEIEHRIKDLESQGVLRSFYNTDYKEHRYHIADPLLKTLIEDLEVLLSHTKDRMEKIVWLIRSPRGKPQEIKWYDFLYSDQQKSIIFSGCSLARQNLESMRKRRGPERMDLQGRLFEKEKVGQTKDNSELVELDKQLIDKMISRKWNYIEDKYHLVRKEYSEIYDLMTKNTYPEFMRKWIH